MNKFGHAALQPVGPLWNFCLSAALMLDRGTGKKPNPNRYDFSSFRGPGTNRHGLSPGFPKAATKSDAVLAPRLLRRRGTGDRYRRASAGYLWQAGLCAPRDRT